MSSTSSHGESDSCTAFPTHSTKCYQLHSVIQRWAPCGFITQENNPKTSLKESLTQPFSVDNLIKTLPSSQPQVDFAEGAQQGSPHEFPTTESFCKEDFGENMDSNVKIHRGDYMTEPNIGDTLSYENSVRCMSKEYADNMCSLEHSRPIEKHDGEMDSSMDVNASDHSVRQCPLCQVMFDDRATQMERDSHIAQCLSVAENEIVW